MNSKKLLYLLLCTAFISCTSEKKEAATKPNIVFIFADDMTYTAINALGNGEIQTPNLDRLVASGTTFTHAYNMGGWNGAICIASRSMIISGRSIWDANAFRQRWLRGTGYDQTWGKLMESAGYDTYMTGKWHIDAPADSVFKNVTHVRPGMPSDSWNHDGRIKWFNGLLAKGTTDSELRKIGYNRPMGEVDSTWSPDDTKFGGYWQGGKHWSEVLKDDALGYIANTNKSDKPFFMYLAFNAPHDPRQAPHEYLEKYPLDRISLPESWLPEYPYKDSIGNGKDLRDEALAPFPRTAFAIKTHIKEYYALITHLDDQIGAIVKALEATGKMDNTYIIFTADHGLSVGRHGLIGKQSQFDHSIRPPFMIMGPKVPKGKKVDADIYLQDAMATSLELAGIEKPDYVFFNSILPLVHGESEKSAYPSIYGAYVDLQRMIRKDGYKLIVYPKLHKVLLFDLQNDPDEMIDLAGNENNKDKIGVLFKELLQLQKDLDDHLDITALYEQTISK